MDNPNASAVIQDRLKNNLGSYYDAAGNTAAAPKSSGGANFGAHKTITTRKTLHGQKSLPAATLDALRANAASRKQAKPTST